MKKQLLTATACLVLAGLAPLASAEVPVTLKAGAGYWFFDREINDMEPEDTATPYVGAEWAFNDNWAAEVMFADEETDFDDGGPDVDVTLWSLGVNYYAGSYIGESLRLRPYATLSAGEIKFDVDNDFDTVETTVNGGMGVRWMLGRRVGLDVGARAVYSLDESETDLLALAGLSFYLGKVDPDPVAEPAPEPTPEPAPVAKVASIKLKVNFDFDKTVVKEQYFSDLQELANFLKRFSDLHVDVEGHTDSVGTDAYNQDLSQRRAQAVVDVLVNEYGISAGRLQPKGYGESQPVASNDSKEGRAENRRVMATLEVNYTE